MKTTLKNENSKQRKCGNTNKYSKTKRKNTQHETKRTKPKNKKLTKTTNNKQQQI